MDYEKHRYRGTCIFWIIVYLLFAVCVCNVALTIYLISVFEIGKGMRFIEVVDDKIMNFYGDVDLGLLTKFDGLIEGFTDPFEIETEKEPLHINLMSRIHSTHHKFRQDREGIHISGINNFEIKSDDKTTVFNAQQPSFNLNEPAISVVSDIINTNGKISSAVDEKLSVLARHKLDLKGNEGMNIEAMEVLFSSDKDINLRSENGSIELKGKGGVYVDIDRVLREPMENGLLTPHRQFKLCYCYPSGRIFKVPAQGKHACLFSSTDVDPCK